mgnify:CR=1 FL=1
MEDRYSKKRSGNLNLMDQEYDQYLRVEWNMFAKDAERAQDGP